MSSRSQQPSADDSMRDANAGESRDEHRMTDDPHTTTSTTTSTSSSTTTTSSSPSSSLPPLKFRNYRPKDPSIAYIALPRPSYAADSVWLDGELASLVESAVAHDNADVLLSIAPKSLNWDLKRDLAPKLATLKKQTAKALQELARPHYQRSPQRLTRLAMSSPRYSTDCSLFLCSAPLSCAVLRRGEGRSAEGGGRRWRRRSRRGQHMRQSGG